MEVPYGFDCYTFEKNEIKLFEPDITQVRESFLPPNSPLSILQVNEDRPPILSHPLDSPFRGVAHPKQRNKREIISKYVKFTRKNEEYTQAQLQALMKAGRLNASEAAQKDSRIFCGIKIQIGIGVVTNFLHAALQYRPPIGGKSELINGTWTGIVSGLTMDRNSPQSYDIAFGNFLAYDEEFPHMKFGPFFAIESKLVVLTGSSRQIEASSFGTNMDEKVGLTVLALMIILSLLAAFRLHWQRSKHKAIDEALEQLAREESRKISRVFTSNGEDGDDEEDPECPTIEVATASNERSTLSTVLDFFFIYATMLLNKPSLEFDDLIWPKHNPSQTIPMERTNTGNRQRGNRYREILRRRKRKRRRHLPTTIRIVSYLWSAACLVMASIYSGELLAVILLHTDQNIDTISQLINSRPPIEPVIRQDDFTYNLMLKSLDRNMLILHNMTRMIPRAEVYTKRFIESVSNRKQALLGDDELIETIYDIYHKYYPLYKSKVTYLQFPISIIYRNDFNGILEKKLRRGIVQIFEMGLIQRWYQAQKDTYIQFYDTYEKKETKDDTKIEANSVDQKYKPLSMHHFESFFKFMLMCKIYAFLILGVEILVWRFRVRFVNRCGDVSQ